MKIFFAMILAWLLVFGCEKNPASLSPSPAKLILTTDRNSYSQKDSVHITLKNLSGRNIILGYRCSFENLEMHYQKRVDNAWSKNLWFDYLSWKCPTIMKEYKSGVTVRHSISASEFKTSGTFRLLVPCSFSATDSTVVAVSNPFEIH
ncbi:MAG TPA: hypothetical protein ENJ23_01810 [Bacteroidetes bacterium]|nr:hypothetical protein [Bacteroidota bacterium]